RRRPRRRIRAHHAPRRQRRGRTRSRRGRNVTAPLTPAAKPLLQPRLDTGSGFPTLLRKELLRFWKVAFQTIAAPVVTALLYLLVFSQVLEGLDMVYGSAPAPSVLLPGRKMRRMQQT